MLKLIIEDDEGRKTVVPFVRDEITIGRQEGNTIRLTERNVSRRHARLVRLNGHVVVEDLGSYNGTRINGERIAGQSPLGEGDLIQIGDYDLALQAEGAANAVGPITTKVPTRRQEAEPEPEEPERSASEEGPGDGEENDHTPPSSSADKRRNSTSIIRLDHVEADRPRKLEDVSTDDAPRLVVLTPDELRGQEFACIRTELRIGRTDDNDITLDHRSLSRTHAKLVREATGEWRVIDMQSANGMTVNGESYAQATLNSGDIVELGHVKLRFLLAGDAADEAPSTEGGMSKMPLVAGLIALMLGGGGVIFWMTKQAQLGTSPTPPDTVVVQQPAPPEPTPVVEPEKPPAGDTPPATAQAANPPVQPTPEAPPPEVTLEEKLGEARTAADALEFDKAEEVLKGIKSVGKPPAEVQALLKEIRDERGYKKLLDDAPQAIADGRFTDVDATLKSTASTKLLKPARQDVEVRLAEARKKVAAANVPPPVQNTSGTVETPKGPPTADEVVATRVAEALSDGKKFRSKDPDLAIKRLKECINLDPKQFECHLFLGSAYAYATPRKTDESIAHFQRFLDLAPKNHPQRAGAEKVLSEFDALKQQK